MKPSERSTGSHLKIGVTSFATHGGSGIVATELGLKLAELGHEIHFISNAVPVRLREFEPNVFFHEVQTSTYPAFPHAPYTLALATRMTEVVRYHGLDLLHVHYAIPHAASSYLARQMLPSGSVKTVTTLHGTDITLVGQDPSFWPLTKFVIEQSDGVTAVSEFLRAETRSVFSVESDIQVIPNFVDTDVFKPQPELRDRNSLAEHGEKILFHASNFRAVKNIETVVRVFAEVRARVPCRLVLVGDGPERGPAEALSRELGVAADVVFLGSRESMAELMAMADVLLLPSEHESFGLVALEAMSAGTPVVATNRGGLPELIEHGVTGFLHDPQDVLGQSQSTLALCRDPELSQRIGAAAREVAQERYCVDCVLGAYLSLYEKLVGSG